MAQRGLLAFPRSCRPSGANTLDVLCPSGEVRKEEGPSHPKNKQTQVLTASPTRALHLPVLLASGEEKLMGAHLLTPLFRLLLLSFGLFRPV